MRSHSLPRGVLVIGFIAVLTTGVSIARAADNEDPATIRAAVDAALAPRIADNKDAKVEANIAAIDPRLQLPRCPAIDVVLPPTNAAAMTAKVSCDTPRWTVYVPVQLHAWVDAVVAAANLAPNRALTSRDLTRGRVDLYNNNGGVITRFAEAEGKILRAGVNAGSPILSPFLDLPVAVHRGQRVTVTLTDRSLVIKTMATALEDGRIGDSITVQNPDSLKTVRATVAADGNVEMRF